MKKVLVIATLLFATSVTAAVPAEPEQQAPEKTFCQLAGLC